ncbi:lipocalin-like domain-containing protein [Neolewinella litorea]|uniref:Lipocalin-like domain-containing protein n=1 Tax=Neolewinella litorea TaxID=2562452 RepID=A0A4V3XLA5_9BACT|nr:lipocalin family protein [Neolewinella litorea]THH40073.1 hypothetical protein E4021_10765 [Neolewinella litorea]
MTRKIAFVLPLLALIACNREDAEITHDLTGTWELVAVYADPGDGSGTYQPVTSDNVLLLLPDGKFRANFSYCPASDASTEGDTGTYSVQDNTLRPNCDGDTRLPFTVSGDTLTVTNPACIEGCGERYAKVSDEIIPL